MCHCAGQITCIVLRLQSSFIFACSLLQLGLEILAFPCNQFAGQEPDSDEKIVEFACNRFQAEFPIFRKVYPAKNLYFHFYVCASFQTQMYLFSI